MVTITSFLFFMQEIDLILASVPFCDFLRLTKLGMK
jgi:hypothetical protein